MRQLSPHVRGLVAAALVLGFVADARAAVPHGILAQRRGRMFRIPPKPANVDSSPTIETLNKALKALGETDRDYDGHREKAVSHIGAAIRHLETPNARGKSNATVEKAAIGKPASSKAATTPQAASDESLRKAKTILFSVHHQLADHTATKGHIRADADIRIAISEIVAALTPSKTTKAASPAANTSSATRAKASN